jgi:hypothetical protein
MLIGLLSSNGLSDVGYLCCDVVLALTISSILDGPETTLSCCEGSPKEGTWAPATADGQRRMASRINIANPKRVFYLEATGPQTNFVKYSGYLKTVAVTRPCLGPGVANHHCLAWRIEKLTCAVAGGASRKMVEGRSFASMICHSMAIRQLFSYCQTS